MGIILLRVRVTWKGQNEDSRNAMWFVLTVCVGGGSCIGHA